MCYLSNLISIKCNFKESICRDTRFPLFFFFIAALKAIDDADCDIITKRRVREVNEIPGALWHIYCAEEADKIRDLLNKVIDLSPMYI